MTWRTEAGRPAGRARGTRAALQEQQATAAEPAKPKAGLRALTTEAVANLPNAAPLIGGEQTVQGIRRTLAG